MARKDLKKLGETIEYNCVKNYFDLFKSLGAGVCCVFVRDVKEKNE